MRRNAIPAALLAGAAILHAGPLPAATPQSEVQNIRIVPAPPLTPAEIDRLKKVKAWDLEFSGLRERQASGSGTFGVPPHYTDWSRQREIRRSWRVRARIAGQHGPSDCRLGSTSNPCVVQYTPDGKVEVSSYLEHVHDTFDSDTGCGFMLRDPLIGGYSDIRLDGAATSYVPDGTPGKAATGDVEIDYTQNPPIAYGNLAYLGEPYHLVREGSGCGQTSRNEGDNVGFVDAGWWPPASGCCADGDSQVRVEHGAFVVHGKSDWTFQGEECLLPGSPLCADPSAERAPFTGHEHYEWTLREHDCQDVNGNGNSDDDDDGLCDNWERDGIDVDGDGTIDLPLNKPPYDADPEHKDLFVEIDFMDDPANAHTERPTRAALNMVKNAFAFAPVTNPDGLRGVRLHPFVDEALPHSPRIGFPENIVAGCNAASFDALKTSNFGTAAERADANAANILEAKARAFRYAVFAHQQADESDGSGGCRQTTSSGVAELPGNDLIVTIGSWGFPNPALYTGGGPKDCFSGEAAAACAIRHAQAATFMHEFGHTLGLHHGGADDFNCKPNYMSVMNYSFQFRTLVSTRPLDYSGGVSEGPADDPFAPLDETNLSEPAGITGPFARNSVYGADGRTAYILLNHPIDWNGDPDGRTDETGVKSDVARLDVKPACARGESVDAGNLTLTFSGGLDPGSVPAPSAFTVHVNGATSVTPAAAAIANGRLYLALPAPARAGDAYTVDYAVPGVNPLQDPTGLSYAAFSGDAVPNVTGELRTLVPRDDWATLRYDMRLAPAFADGDARETVPIDETTQEEADAGAEGLDFDGDGVSNALDDCPATYDPGQEDLDADGYGDACEPSADEDDVEPASTAIASPPPNASGWSTAEVTVSLTAADDPNGSGVKEIDYVVSGAQAAPARSAPGESASVTISADGESSVKFFAIDNAGNPELPHAVTVRIDRTAPAIAAAADPPPNAAGWNAGDVTVTYTCDDAGSGIASCGAPAVLGGEGAGLSATGSATDVAGNASQATVGGINIDRTSPVVTCQVTPSVLWPPKHRMIPVTATVNVSDALSGPAGFVLTSVTSSEPDSVKKKDKPGDVAGFAVGSASTTGQLRAEKIAKTGRTYTLTWEGRDAAGNAASCSATVAVPAKKPR